MKILHTADLHLREAEGPRWQALGELVHTAREQGADLLTIAGDLFDSDADAEALRPRIRELFRNAPFQTLVIPGNHDARAYPAGFYFGEGVVLLSAEDWTENRVDHPDAVVIGVPFAELEARDFHLRLRELGASLPADRPRILLYHGELLDASFDRGAFGPEEAGRYMPSRLTFFREAGFDYVLAGHFHSNFDVRTLGPGKYFVYPGSPAAVTRREVGRRKAALIEVGQEPREVPLETFHYQRVVVRLDAFRDGDPLVRVRAALKDADPAARLLLEVSGTIRGSEAELAEALRELLDEDAPEPDFTFRDISRLVSDPVYELFERELDQLGGEEEDFTAGELDRVRERVREMVLRAMAEAEL